MAYLLKETEDFEKQFSKLPKDIRLRFEKQFNKLKENPFALGKPLKGYPWFRELKCGVYRVYYLVYESEVIVLFVGVSDKKSQQEMIDFIIKHSDYFKTIINK